MAQWQEQTADALPARIGQVVMLHHAGDREEARSRLLALWADLGTGGDPLHRCTLAHFLADTQDDPAAELAWDLRALAAAEEATGPHPSPPPAAVRAFLPSLHLDLAADYAGLGRAEAARSHLRQARTTATALGEDGYGTTVRAALTRLTHRLEKELPPEPEEGPPRPGPGGGPLGPPRHGH
ncbi:hypothetical protein [Streptomyces sp. NPDC058045]|uniref:hypothetical protein n=1 Tax=Streptomyces sp. NPDC058045 TaxID=3346311 RepID=UPI0036E6B113